VLLLALLAGTTTAFALTEALKLEKSPVSRPRFKSVFSPTCACPRETWSERALAWLCRLLLAMGLLFAAVGIWQWTTKNVFWNPKVSEVYGDPQVHPQPETYWGHVNPIGPRGVYDEAKRYAEALTMAYHRQQGVDTCIARIFNTYGPRMRPHDGRAVPTFMQQALENKPLTVFGDGSQTRSFCHVDDLIHGLYLLAQSEEHLPVNLGNPQEMTLLELAEIVLRVTGARSEIVFEALPVDDPQVRQPDITRAKQILGWEPEVRLEDGLRRTIEWMTGGERAVQAAPL